ncbi:MAG: hypothetical protein HOP12_03325, partial [Candidatus Eisenbacteria bacterium]|nr:hypothetical protein [Candidatus Eisenbacteria bacterium]
MTRAALAIFTYALLQGAATVPVAARAATRSVAVALPDTGLFSPVAAQLEAQRALLAALPAVRPSPERVWLLLDSGQPDQAAREATRLGVEDEASVVARARARLAIQDFTALEPLMARLADFDSPDARDTRYAWERARDASAAIDSLTRTRLAGGDSGVVPELLAAGRLAHEMLEHARAESLFDRALGALPTGDSSSIRRARAAARLGRALVMQKRREWDASLAELERTLDD